MIKKPQVKIAIVVTSVLQIKFFMIPHILALNDLYDITLIVKNDHPEILADMQLPIRIVEVNVERKIHFLNDILALFTLFSIFKKGGFDLVHTLTPKAGLLGGVAARLARVRIRIHTFQGEVWVNKKGIYRLLLKSLDKLVASLATNLMVVSYSERDFLIKERVIIEGQSDVLANGSISGVDLKRFKFNQAIRDDLRYKHSIPNDAIVFIYIGRLNLEKGIPELIKSFQQLAIENLNVRLFVVGPDEDNILNEFANRSRQVIFCPYATNPEEYLMASDVLVLPSHREGFGVVIIEAAAVGVPSIGSNIYGIQDAIEDGVTGLLFESKNIISLYAAMKLLAEDQIKRLDMGVKAQHRVDMLFDQQKVVSAMVKYYKKLLD